MIGMRVLIVEKERLVAEELMNGLERMGVIPLGIAATGEEALRHVRRERPDLVLMDIRSKQGSGGIAAACDIEDQFGIPCVFVSAQSDEYTLVRAQQTAPAGSLLRPFDDLALRTSLTLARRERRARMGEDAVAGPTRDGGGWSGLREQATTDAVTGLWNRQMLHRQMKTEGESARRSDRPLSVLLLDLDHFKTISERHGLRAGDAALMEIARRIEWNVRPADIVGRYSGAEFLVVMPGTSGIRARAVAERIHQSVRQTALTMGELTLALSVSVGVGCMTGHVEEAELLDAADASLHTAKQAGSDAVGPLVLRTPPPLFRR